MGKRKAAIVGAGYVGASITYALTLRNLAGQIILIDKDSQKAKGEAMDIQHGRPTIASVTSVLQGEYGIDGVSLSVPSVIGVNGVEKRIEKRWNESEFAAFNNAASKLKNKLSGM